MSIKNCPQCGVQVYDELAAGLCPTCLMDAARQYQHEVDATRGMSEGFETPSIEQMAAAFPELEILEFIGRGGMGAVYKVRQRNLDRIVALKVFLYRTEDPEFAARFQREARALARLNHPNIVTVHDFGERDSMHYLIMEYVEGLNLRQLTADEKLRPEMALQMVPQLCDALQYAHDRGVIHRDIKPENLLLDTDGKINIADFGLAKMTGSKSNHTLTRTQQVMGTLNYMAPEQRERPTEVDHRADIYSLGVVIYEMLTGELPMGRFQPPSSKSNVKVELDEVVMRALEREPERRYQQVSEFASGFVPYKNDYVDRRPENHQPVPPVPPVKSNHIPNHIPYADSAQPSRGTRVMVTIMSGREQTGNWVPGHPQLVFTFMGGTKIDLREVKQKNVDLTLMTIMGAAEVIVPEGANVDLDGFVMFGATDEKTVGSSNPNGMNVRIRSWGAMSGCEIRSPNSKEIRARNVAMQREARKRNPTPIAQAMVAFYKLFATLVTIAIPILFLCGAFNIMSDNDSQMAGIIVAISAGLFWAQLDYVRIMLGAGPENDSPDKVAAYYSSTKFGTFIRMIAMVFLFACPILLVVGSFENERLLKLIGICCAIASAFIFSAADKTEEAIFQNRKQENQYHK